MRNNNGRLGPRMNWRAAVAVTSLLSMTSPALGQMPRGYQTPAQQVKARILSKIEQSLDRAMRGIGHIQAGFRGRVCRSVFEPLNIEGRMVGNSPEDGMERPFAVACGTPDGIRAFIVREAIGLRSGFPEATASVDMSLTSCPVDGEDDTGDCDDTFGVSGERFDDGSLVVTELTVVTPGKDPSTPDETVFCSREGVHDDFYCGLDNDIGGRRLGLVVSVPAEAIYRLAFRFAAAITRVMPAIRKEAVLVEGADVCEPPSESEPESPQQQRGSEGRPDLPKGQDI